MGSISTASIEVTGSENHAVWMDHERISQHHLAYQSGALRSSEWGIIDQRE